ncbi:undecaprenyl-diphosphate phosphatase [Bacillaceae bacterium SIJ1]|uniref:undecaprenyl-diphosphate phosphatase n=1 Tax=Litoribacterium kuwaitense TaxID=1398745 RepID=UPI0013EBFCB5|nr:undecaprenyl-diphosphate phosphatase [Litoribacterium kuwaitense]NGP46687.1 undecaprenyl-diphosphate phosphatase [Litoribacterium kuwaitense]
MDVIMFFKAIILGIVEGLTEFAPVSSTGHMIIVDDLWLQSNVFLTAPVANTFKVVIQLGSILAVVIVFWPRLLNLLHLKKPGRAENGQKRRLRLTHVFIGLLPAGALGVLFEDLIDTHLFSTRTVIFGLILGAFLMIAADRFAPKTMTQRVDEITYQQAFFIGLIQCFSLWPGFSRSGSTISGGVLLGLSHRAAADFTFIMAVPIMAGASVLSLIKNWQYFTLDVWPFFLSGFIASFVVALLTIHFFLKLIDRIKLVPFALYRIGLALVITLVIYF